MARRVWLGADEETNERTVGRLCMETVRGGDGGGDGGTSTSPCGMPVGDGDEMGSGRTGGEGGGETIDDPILVCSAVRVAG